MGSGFSTIVELVEISELFSTSELDKTVEISVEFVEFPVSDELDEIVEFVELSDMFSTSELVDKDEPVEISEPPLQPDKTAAARIRAAIPDFLYIIIHLVTHFTT